MIEANLLFFFYFSLRHYILIALSPFSTLPSPLHNLPSLRSSFPLYPFKKIKKSKTWPAGDISQIKHDIKSYNSLECSSSVTSLVFWYQSLIGRRLLICLVWIANMSVALVWGLWACTTTSASFTWSLSFELMSTFLLKKKFRGCFISLTFPFMPLFIRVQFSFWGLVPHDLGASQLSHSFTIILKGQNFIMEILLEH